MRDIFVLSLVCLSLALGACGTKPGSVEKGERRTYPDPEMNTNPGGGAPITLPSGH